VVCGLLSHIAWSSAARGMVCSLLSHVAASSAARSMVCGLLLHTAWYAAYCHMWHGLVWPVAWSEAYCDTWRGLLRPVAWSVAYCHTRCDSRPQTYCHTNRSFREGIFPSCFKHASVVPLLKKPSLDKHVPSSYRPISNLDFISKILKRLFLAPHYIVTHLQSVAVSISPPPFQRNIHSSHYRQYSPLL